MFWRQKRCFGNPLHLPVEIALDSFPTIKKMNAPILCFGLTDLFWGKWTVCDIDTRSLRARKTIYVKMSSKEDTEGWRGSTKALYRACSADDLETKAALIHPLQRCTMRLLYSRQASLSAQTQCIEKTVDTHKTQFPLHHAQPIAIFLGVMLNLVEPSVTPPCVVSGYFAATAIWVLTAEMQWLCVQQCCSCCSETSFKKSKLRTNLYFSQARCLILYFNLHIALDNCLRFHWNTK